MSRTKALAIAELTLRITRERIHTANALARLAQTPQSARIRRGHGCERATSVYWRRARRHLRNVRTAELQLVALGVVS